MLRIVAAMLAYGDLRLATSAHCGSKSLVDHNFCANCWGYSRYMIATYPPSVRRFGSLGENVQHPNRRGQFDRPLTQDSQSQIPVWVQLVLSETAGFVDRTVREFWIQLWDRQLICEIGFGSSQNKYHALTTHGYRAFRWDKDREIGSGFGDRMVLWYNFLASRDWIVATIHARQILTGDQCHIVADLSIHSLHSNLATKIVTTHKSQTAQPHLCWEAWELV